MSEIEEKIIKCKRDYYRKYREKNRERINQRYREWSNTEEGKKKIAAAQKRYWERKALKESNL